MSPLPELAEPSGEVVHWGDGKKHLTDDYLKSLSPLAWAIWLWTTAHLPSVRWD